MKSTILSFSFDIGTDDLMVTRLQIHEDNDMTAWISLQGQHVLFVFDTF